MTKERSETPNVPESSTASPGQPARAAVEALFAKFRAMYGAKLADQWKGCDLDEVKAAWDESLSDLTMEEVRLGLRELVRAGRPFPPTLPEFYALCRPRIEVPPLSDHTGLERLARELGVSTKSVGSYYELRVCLIEAIQDRRTRPRLQ